MFSVRRRHIFMIHQRCIESRLSKGQSDLLKQNCVQEKEQFSGTIFHDFLHGVTQGFCKVLA